MPLNEVPKHIGPQTRSLIEAALEDAWQELNKDGTLETTPARNKLKQPWLHSPLSAKPTIESSSGSPSMLGKGHYRRSNPHGEFELAERRLSLVPGASYEIILLTSSPVTKSIEGLVIQNAKRRP
jgi:hypothetical protein